MAHPDEPTVVPGPLADGLPLCHSCLSGEHACAEHDCTCPWGACEFMRLLLDQGARFITLPSLPVADD